MWHSRLNSDAAFRRGKCVMRAARSCASPWPSGGPVRADHDRFRVLPPSHRRRARVVDTPEFGMDDSSPVSKVGLEGVPRPRTSTRPTCASRTRTSRTNSPPP